MQGLIRTLQLILCLMWGRSYGEDRRVLDLYTQGPIILVLSAYCLLFTVHSSNHCAGAISFHNSAARYHAVRHLYTGFYAYPIPQH